ncbi:AI-2E family transporter [Pseudohalioglobus sediminis]|uniref:AI-2E family transporter n=1 Tax=Pseudohalioglobus sediminis TaxID=2606449 RepID=A0A5B0X0P8_9GAMM|nr:AI-2E family transporter [Pseudohalioglobus sediminis]KAA1192853.1 AI-2E family transporter [Pseudohalioglobus sediminis]
MAELDPLEKAEVYRWPIALGVLAALAVLLYFLQPILTPFVLGGLIGYLGDPLVDRLERKGMQRTLGVVLVFILFSAIIIVALLVALPMLLHQLDALVAKVPDIYRWLTQDLVPWLQQRFDLPDRQLPKIDWSGQLADNWQSVGKFTARSLMQITGSGAGLLLSLANLALVPVVAFYLMRDWDILVRLSLDILPIAWQDKAAELVAESDEVVGAFLRGQFLVMCSLGIVYSVGLWLVGVQLAMLLGIIAGLASIVPYLGFIVGVIASCIVAYAQFGDWTVLLWVGLVFGVGQAIESMVLTPVLVGDRIGLHPVAVIFALMAGGQIAGFVGVVLALPVAAVVMVFLRHAMHHYRSSDLYGRD